MQVKKLGIEWGAAYEEAQPIEVSNGSAKVLIFVSESGDLVIQTSGETMEVILVHGNGFEITLYNED